MWPCPPSLQGKDAPPTPVTQGVGSEPNGLLLPSVHDLTTTVEDLMYQSTEATLIAPRWESAPWYADAKAACASHEVLLIPEFCPGGQRQRLTVNKSILLV